MAAKKLKQVHMALDPKKVEEWSKKASADGLTLTAWIKLRVDGRLRDPEAI